MVINFNTRNEALALHLGCEMEDLTESEFDATVFEYYSEEYVVLTDDEATAKAASHIEETLWAFNPSVLVNYMPDGVDEEIIRILQDKCESRSNAAILRLVGDNLDAVIDDVIMSDGRGLLLGTYDGDEHEVGEFLVYRIN